MSRFLFAAVFLGSGFGKVNHLDRFSTTLKSYGLPAPLVKPSAILVAIVELFLGIAWPLSPGLTSLAAITLVVLATFTAGVIRAMRAGVMGGCGCDGLIGADRIGPHVVYRNVVLGTAAVAAAIPGTSQSAVNTQADILLASVAGALLLLFLVHLLTATGSLAVTSSEVQDLLAQREMREAT